MAYSALVRLYFDPDRRTPIRVNLDDDYPYAGLFHNPRLRHSVPSKAVLRSGALRQPSGEIADDIPPPREDEGVVVCCSYGWRLATRSGPAPAEGEAAPIVSPGQRSLPSWANWIYQTPPAPRQLAGSTDFVAMAATNWKISKPSVEIPDSKASDCKRRGI